MIPAEKDAPRLFLGKPDIFKLRCIDRFHYETQIQQTVLDHLFDVIRHPIVKVKLNIRISLAEFSHPVCQGPTAHCFRGSDPDRPADHILLVSERVLQLIRQLYDRLCLLLEQISFVSQCNGTFSPDQKGRSHLILKLHQLTAEGGLGDVQDIRRSRNISFICYCKKVFQYTQFHAVSSFRSS